MKVRIVFTGRSYHAASETPDEVELPDGASVKDAIRQLSDLMPNQESVPATCLVAVCGDHLGTVDNHAERTLRDGDELILIAPVAGG